MEALHLIPDPEDDNWLPLIAYRGSLSDGSEEMRPPERPAPRAAVTKGVRGRKRKIEGMSSAPFVLSCLSFLPFVKCFKTCIYEIMLISSK